MMSLEIKSKKRGFTMVETLVYAAGVVLIIGVIVSILYYTYRWYNAVAMPTRVDQIGTALADRLQKDIRSASAVGVSSILNNDSGILYLTTMTSSSTSVAKSYTHIQGRVAYQEGVTVEQYITPPDINITQLNFSKSTTTISTAIRYTISIRYPTNIGQSSTTYATSTYSGFAIMRNTYE